MRAELLKKIHSEGHFSPQKFRKIVAEKIWWPGISTELVFFD
jgi:hypothetical protein